MKRTRRGRSLLFQLMAVFLVVSVVTFSLGAILSYRKIFTVLSNNNERHLNEVLENASERLAQTLGEVERIASVLSQNEYILELADDGFRALEPDTVFAYRSAFNAISNVVTNMPGVFSIYVFRGDGLLLGASKSRTFVNWNGVSSITPNAISAPYGAGKRFGSLFVSGMKESDFNLNLHRPELDADLITLLHEVPIPGMREGALCLALNVRASDIALLFTKGGEDEYLVSQNGALVCGTGGAAYAAYAPLRERIVFSKSSGAATDSLDGKPVQTVYHRIEGTNLFLVRHYEMNALTEDSRDLMIFMLVCTLACILILLVVTIIWIRRVLSPIDCLMASMDDLKRGGFGVTLDRVPNNEIGTLITRYNEMSVSIAELVQKNEKAQREKAELEMKALQAQLNPHFLYNTLNMIKWMSVMIKADNITQCIVTLGKLLEPVFQAANRTWEVREELGYLEHYIQIMNWRFGNRCLFSIDVPDELSRCVVPKFILQPIIENCFIHGMPRTGEFAISIKAWREGDKAVFALSNNGVAIEPSRLSEVNAILSSEENQSASVGLFNVSRRLQLYFGSESGIRVCVEEAGDTVVRLTFPLQTSPSEGNLDKS